MNWISFIHKISFTWLSFDEIGYTVRTCWIPVQNKIKLGWTFIYWTLTADQSSKNQIAKTVKIEDRFLDFLSFSESSCMVKSAKCLFTK